MDRRESRIRDVRHPNAYYLPVSKERSDDIEVLAPDEVRAHARAAGVDVPEEDLLEVRLRLSVLLDAMARVSDARVDDGDPDPLGRS